MKNLIFFLFLFPSLSQAQNELVKSTIQKIDIGEDTIQSVFKWVIQNIDYDPKLMEAVEDYKNISNRNANKINTNEARINYALKTNKGVCFHYAELLCALVKELGYESYVIQGMTKKNNKIPRIGHAWTAIEVNGIWKLYDPTWGSGYLSPKTGKFVRKENMDWYDVDSAEMLKSHMPYDPIWQLNDHPITYADFENDTIVSNAQNEIDFEQELDLFFESNEITQLRSSLNRSLELGEAIFSVHRWRMGQANQINYAIFQKTMPKLEKSKKLYDEFMLAKQKAKGKKVKINANKESLLDHQKSLQESIALIEQAESLEPSSYRTIRQNLVNAKRLLKFVTHQLTLIE